MSIVERISNTKISKDTRVALWSTFVIGLICHGFWYTNMYNLHDDAWLSMREEGFVINGAGGKFLGNMSGVIFHNTQVPWLYGIFTLFLYFLTTFMICRLFEIKETILVIIVSGILVTSPTVISSNYYMGSMVNNAISFFLSVLAVYVFYKMRYGWIWALGILYLVSALYTAYVDVTASLFLVLSIYKMVCKKIEFKKLLREHLIMLVIGVTGVLSELITCLILIKKSGDNFYGRLEGLAQGSMVSETELASSNSMLILDISSRFKNAISFVVKFFSPKSHVSFFQGIPVVYWTYILLIMVSIIALLMLIIKQKIYKNIGSIILLIIDLILLPLMMNAIGLASYYTHMLMMASFIVPVLLCISIFNYYINNDDFKLMKFIWAYEIVVLFYSFITISESCIVANIAYTEAHNAYNAGMSRVTRIVDHIESIEGYIPGETEVILVGKLPEYDVRKDGGYRVASSFTGFENETAFTYYGPFVLLITQHLASDMKFVFTEGDNGNKLDTCMEELEKRGYDNLDLLEATIKDLNCFPAVNYTYLWADYQKLLVYCIGEVE